MSKEVFELDVAETRRRKECLDSTVVLVDTASLVSKVERIDVMVGDMEV